MDRSRPSIRSAALTCALAVVAFLSCASVFADGEMPVQSAPSATDIAPVFAAEITEFGTPLIPGMSSLALRFPLRFVPSREGEFSFLLDYWYMSGTYYLHFDPFVEMGFLLTYADYRRGNSYFAASAGVAVEFNDLTFSVPAVAGMQWSHALGGTGLWAGVDGQVFVWPDGVGVELATPLDFYPRARVYGSIAPEVIVYFVDGLIHFNLKTGVTLGIRGGRRS